MKLKIDKDNRRIRNLLDNELLFVTEKIENNKTFTKEDIEELDTRFKEVCIELQKIDKNITENSLKYTGEVSVNEILKDLEIDKDTLSSNKIRNILAVLIDSLIDTKEDFYFQVVVTVCLIAGLCDIYLKNTNTESNIDFKEVEDRYER